MASLRQEHHYRLYCGNNHRGRSGNRTLFHVKLTDSAIRTLEAHQNLKESSLGKASICFKGNQGYIKIPAPTPDSPSALRVFTFYLSSDSKDQPQASFDCIHQYVSSDGREQLEGQGVIQDKLTVSATDDSYQLTRERMSQVEKDSWSHSAIEIKPRGTHQITGIKLHKSLTPTYMSDNSFQKQITNNRRNGFMATGTHKPFRERIIHLLALKAYRKPELLLWMERERASPKDKAELGGILEEVAKVNPKDSSYMLRDHFYKLVQKDWPSYSEEEKMLIGRLLARKLPPNACNQPKNLQANTSVLKSSDYLSHSLATTTAGKRPVPFDSLERLALKRQKLADQMIQQQPAENGLMSHNSHNAISPSLNPSLPSKTDFPQANALTGTQNGFPVILSSIPKTHTRKQETKVPLQSDCMQQPLITILHKKKKSKKHKDKERARLTDGKGDGWLETSKLKQKYTKRDDPNIRTTAEEKPDYVLMYSPVMSLGQRQSYKEDFCAEFDEYKDLHSRIATITHMFVKLGSKIKSLSPGTPEYKMMEDQILEQYNKYQKKFPGYREEKKRCEYLHEKLSYIKQLIVDYDVSQAPT